MKRFGLPLFAWSDKKSAVKSVQHESVVVDGVVLNGQPEDGTNAAGGDGGKFYGIRSYLHSFYVHPPIEEIESGKGQGATWSVFLCHVILGIS